VHGFRRIYHEHKNRFGHTPLVFLGNVCRMEACFSPFGDSVCLEQDRCTVYAEHTIARKSFWAQPMVLQRDVGQVETRFGPFGDSVNLDAR
jgi:hypothetical protein